MACATSSALVTIPSPVGGLFEIFDGREYHDVKQMVNATKEFNGYIWVSLCKMAARINGASASKSDAMYHTYHIAYTYIIYHI